MKRVSYIFPVSHHYRAPFHERLRVLLAKNDIEYHVVYCSPSDKNRTKNDTVDVSWGNKVGLSQLPGGLLYQHGLKQAARSDLVIVQQENKLIFNYLMSLASMLRFKKIAYFGHGRNFQARNRNSLAERWKRLWATRCDWWFAYTDETRRHVESLGFPPERITVFNNAVDTVGVRALSDEVTPERCAARRAELGVGEGPAAIFVGGLYEDKRLSFLIDAADLVHQRIPDFTLLIVGGGVDLPLVDRLAAGRPWIKVLGPRFGADKVELMQLADLFLMPGLLGLAVLDAAAAGLPTVTTAFPWHSPEIAYVEHGVNGVVVADWQNPAAYADTVADLLADRQRLVTMTAEAKAMAEHYTIEAMAKRFAVGVQAALAMPPRR